MAGLKCFAVGLIATLPLTATASTSGQTASASVHTGVSAIWILANISYAGMRAQNSQSYGWRTVAFVFGFPGTLVSLLAVPAGGERAYGIDIPRRKF